MLSEARTAVLRGRAAAGSDRISPGGIEIQSAQMEQDPVAGSLLRLDGFDELI